MLENILKTSGEICFRRRRSVFWGLNIIKKTWKGLCEGAPPFNPIDLNQNKVDKSSNIYFRFFFSFYITITHWSLHNGGGVILDKTTPIRIEVFHDRIKVFSQMNSVLISSGSSFWREMKTISCHRMPPTQQNRPGVEHLGLYRSRSISHTCTCPEYGDAWPHDFSPQLNANQCLWFLHHSTTLNCANYQSM